RRVRNLRHAIRTGPPPDAPPALQSPPAVSRIAPATLLNHHSPRHLNGSLTRRKLYRTVARTPTGWPSRVAGLNFNWRMACAADSSRPNPAHRVVVISPTVPSAWKT